MDGSVVFARWRQCAPRLTRGVSLRQPESTSRTASPSAQLFFAGLTTVTDRPTDRPRYSVCSNRPRCGLITTTITIHFSKMCGPDMCKDKRHTTAHPAASGVHPTTFSAPLIRRLSWLEHKMLDTCSRFLLCTGRPVSKPATYQTRVPYLYSHTWLGVLQQQHCKNKGSGTVSKSFNKLT